ncbi:MAG TPA: ABC transporter permease [Actinocrinis sp.]|uniref:ABC transporter permease n=1 Tax=Actinocrinis sp. TaxID=1920516 RepID=UPI002DDCBAB6|nr:ABC transporter permease [Actinocrinis sp.]HEV2344870.1 ABC transporter permease [Actinocrinis sp.]
MANETTTRDTNADGAVSENAMSENAAPENTASEHTVPADTTTPTTAPDGTPNNAATAAGGPDADTGTNNRQSSLARLEAGLDALDSASAARRRPWWRLALARLLPPVIALVAILLVWDVLVWSHVRSGSIMLPGPGDVWDELRAQWGPSRVGTAIWDSIYRAVIGFAVSVGIGTVIGLAIARVRPLRAAFAPLLSGLQNLPSVAWVPVGIIWFGLTSATIYTVVLLGAVPSIAIGLIDGLDRVPPIYLRVGRNLGAKGLDSVRFVLLPAALPSYVSGMKQGWAFAWRSLMAAELIAISPQLGPGIGQVMKFAQDNLDLPLAMGSIIIILIIGIGVNQVFFAPLERRLLRTRGLSRA